MNALVTDADYVQSLVAVQSLGRRGLSVVAGDSKRLALSFLSRYARGRLRYADPSREPRRFIDDLVAGVERWRPEVLMPVGGLATSLLSRHLERFERLTALPVTGWEAYERALDKAESVALARELGVPVPGTWLPATRGEAEGLAKRLAYPVVVKPRRETGTVRYAGSPPELVRLFSAALECGGVPPMVQEKVAGEGYGFFALMNRGRVRATFMHRRLREYPVTGGPSTLRESVRDEGLERLGLRLLEALEWHGVAMVEFKRDARDGRFVLMEVNPKFWGSLALAVHAGVDFPHLLYRMAVDGDVGPVRDYRVGVRCRRLLPYDLLAILESPGRLGNLRELLRGRDVPCDELSRDDPAPVIYQAFKGIGIAAKRLVVDRALGRRP
jgi:predicted ATP-grasp superfamily ATP-dependent carboligase